MTGDKGNSYACGASVGNGNSAYNGPPTAIDGTRLTMHWWDLV